MHNTVDKKEGRIVTLFQYKTIRYPDPRCLWHTANLNEIMFSNEEVMAWTTH